MSKVILFQGDSITDCGRAHDELNHNLGNGYAAFVKGALGAKYPGEYVFYNRGISGNRIVDLYARIKRDFINLKPDYASIYIGVNDTWHEVTGNNGVETEKFEKIYTMLIDEILQALPDIKLIIVGPFVLESTATCNTEENPTRWDMFKNDVAQKAEVAKKIAEKYNLPFIDLQSAFNDAVKTAPAEYWTLEGVHPNSCGHEIIKNLWIEEFEKIK